MFHNVLVDGSIKPSSPYRRFYGCMQLVCDKLDEAVFYIHSDWGKLEILSEAGLTPSALRNLEPEKLARLKENDLLPSKFDEVDRHRLAYFDKEQLRDATDIDSVPLRWIERQFVLSDSEIINKGTMLEQGINPSSAVLVLAAAGLDIMLPNMSFDLQSTEEVQRFRERYDSERSDYLDALSNIAHQTYEQIETGHTEELLKWALQQVTFELVPKARNLERATRGLSETELRKAGYSFWKEGAPAIGSALIGSGITAAGAVIPPKFRGV